MIHECFKEALSCHCHRCCCGSYLCNAMHAINTQLPSRVRNNVWRERETLRSGYNWQANTKTAAVQWISLCVMSIMCSSVLILENMLSWQMSNEEEKPGNKKAQRSDASFFPRWLLSGTSSYFQETCVCLFPLLKKADDYGAQIGVPGSVSNWDSSSTLLLMMMMAASFTLYSSGFT